MIFSEASQINQDNGNNQLTPQAHSNRNYHSRYSDNESLFTMLHEKIDLGDKSQYSDRKQKSRILSMGEILGQADQIMRSQNKKSSLEYMESLMTPATKHHQIYRQMIPILFTCAVLSHEVSDFKKSKKYYETVICDERRNNFQYEAMMGYACLLQDFEYYKQAETIILETIVKFQHQSTPYFNLGNIYRSLGDFDCALKSYKKCIRKQKQVRKTNKSINNYQSNNEDINCLHNSTTILNLIDQIDQAEDILRLIREKKKHNLSIDFFFCELIYSNTPYTNRNRKFIEAEKLLERAAATVQQKKQNIKESIKLVQHIGNIYKEKGNYLEARKYYKKGIDIINTTGSNIKVPKSITKDYGDLMISIGEYQRASNLYAQLLNSDPYNPEIMLNYLVITQIQTIHKGQTKRKGSNRHWKNLTLSPNTIQLTHKLDQILYPTDHTLKQNPRISQTEHEIFRIYQINYKQNRKHIDIQECENGQEYRYQNQIADRYSIKSSKIKVMKYFATFWIVTISKAINVLYLLENMDRDQACMRELETYFLNQKSSHTLKSMKEMDTLALPPRRKNMNHKTSQTSLQNAIYEKALTLTNHSINSKNIDPGQRNKAKEKIDSLKNELNNDFYGLIKRFWVLLAELLIEKSSPLTHQTKKPKGTLKKYHSLEDLPSYQRILKKQVDQSLNFPSINTASRKTSDSMFHGDFSQKLRNILKVIQYLEDQLKKSRLIQFLLKREPQGIQNNHSKLFIKQHQSFSQNSKLQKQKGKPSKSKPKVFLTEDILADDDISVFEISNRNQLSNQTSMLKVEQTTVLDIAEFLKKKTEKFSNHLDWLHQRYRQTFQMYHFLPMNSDNQVNGLYEMIQKLTWLLAVCFHEIMVTKEESSHRNESTSYINNSYTFFIDKISFLSGLGTIDSDSSPREIVNYIETLVGNLIQTSSQQITKKMKIILYRECQYMKQFTSQDITEQDITKFVGNLVSLGISETFSDAGIKKKLQQWEEDKFDKSKQNHHLKPKKSVLFASFGRNSTLDNVSRKNILEESSFQLEKENLYQQLLTDIPGQLPTSSKFSIIICVLTLIKMLKPDNFKEKSIIGNNLDLSEFIKEALDQITVKQIKKQIPSIVMEVPEFSKLELIPEKPEESKIKSQMRENIRQTRMPQKVNKKWKCDEDDYCIIM